MVEGRGGIDSKEQADHSLQHLVAVALIDGAVGPAQFDPARVGKLAERRIGKGLADEIVAAVKGMETTSARELLGLLHRAPTPGGAAA